VKRLLVALVGIVLFLTSCSVAPSKPREIEYPWQVPSNTIEADGTVFAIPLNAGDRVEIEVSNATGISYLKDPFGNVVARSATKIEYYEEPNYQEKSESDSTPELPKYSPHLVSTQEYPWRFSYIAPSGGNYILSTSGINNNPAHIKVTLNP
jgi:hypothetical protein